MIITHLEELGNNKFIVNGEEVYAPNVYTALKRAGMDEPEAALYLAGEEFTSPKSAIRLITSTVPQQDETTVTPQSKTMKLFGILVAKKVATPEDTAKKGIVNVRGAVRALRSHGHNVKMRYYKNEDDFRVESDLSKESVEKWMELSKEA